MLRSTLFLPYWGNRNTLMPTFLVYVNQAAIHNHYMLTRAFLATLVLLVSPY